MRLDFKSLAFGYNLVDGVSTPAWETSLGQGAGYRLNNTSTISELVKGMIYKAVPPKTINFKMGRGGTTVRGDDNNTPLVSAAVFDNVFINEHQIQNGKFILLIVKDNSASHYGRLKLKYGLDNAYESADGTITKNRDFLNIAATQLGLAEDACWFIYDISVENQDKLRLSAIIVNKDSSETYANSAALHSAWDALIDADISIKGNARYLQGEDVITEDIQISEENFRQWLSQQVKKNGEPLSDEIQKAYYYILKAIPSMLGFESVFKITEPSAFEKHRKEIESSKKYQESNTTVGIGTLSAALTKYGAYLDERNLISIPVDRLAQILKDWCDKKYVENNITSTLVGFGFKYARAINKAGVSAKTLLDLAQIESTMQAYIDRGKNLYAAIEKEAIGFKFEFTNKKSANTFDYSLTSGQAINKIFYGVPGCGKSHHIQKNILETEGYEEKNIIRTTFYQDYSNTDFVGQILPKIVKGENGEKDTVEYIFNPGPFTLALIQAISNPTKKVALVIEEINRGNAPAIFGDIFQLLDRDDNSISEYGIVNVSMRDYLNAYEFDVDGEKKRYIFKDIKIPGNMDIFATMNTSDQNVYTLDTAFTRRWAKERIPNSFNGNDIATYFVPGMELYTWGMFVDAINNQIQNKLDDLQVNEDKQVGAFFVKKSDLLIVDNTLTDEDKKKKARSFAHKVLEYLWDDVSKLDHSVIFNSNYKTFEKVVDDYLEKGVAVFNSEIFKDKPVQNVAGDTN